MRIAHELYEVAKQITLDNGFDYYDPRTGEVTKAPRSKRQSKRVVKHKQQPKKERKQKNATRHSKTVKPIRHKRQAA